MNVSWPTNGSVISLNASEENGASSAASRSILVSSLAFGSRPSIGGTSKGDGR